jgi:RNA polymerase sigma factor (sigma-70 family)
MSGTQITKSLEYSLAARIQTGDRAATMQLISLASGLIGEEIRAYRHWNFDRVDLAGECHLAAVIAATTFDPDLGTWFAHLRMPVRAALVDYARTMGYSATVPADVFKRRASQRTAAAARQFAEAPSVDELTHPTDGAPAFEPAAEPVDIDMRLTLRTAIESLPERQREVLTLVYEANLIVAEIVQVLSERAAAPVTEGVVSMAKQRGLKALRRLLEES